MSVLVITEQQFNELTSKIDLILNQLGQESPSKDWISNEEACELLGVGNTTLYTYRKNGMIKARKIGRKLYFNRQELLEVIEEGSQK